MVINRHCITNTNGYMLSILAEWVYYTALAIIKLKCECKNVFSCNRGTKLKLKRAVIVCKIKIIPYTSYTTLHDKAGDY